MLTESEIALIEYVENNLIVSLRKDGYNGAAEKVERLVGIIDRLTRLND